MEATPSGSTIVVRTHELCGTTVHQRETDGYINATQLCKAAEKLFANYRRNDSTEEFLQELSSVMRIRITELVQVTQGGLPNAQGTWVHPDVAINLAQWLSPRFAVQVSKWVRELLTKGQVSITKPQPRHWYDRLRDTWTPHIRIVRSQFKGMFTVPSEIVTQVMSMEDILHFHNMTTRGEDRPDISVGKRWSSYRAAKGWHERKSEAPLRANEQGLMVMVKVYPGIERAEFHEWFWSIYMPSNYISYLDNKPEFKPYEPLVRASAADHACLDVTGKHALLDTVRREQLAKHGGFYKSPHIIPVTPKAPKRITKRSPRKGSR